MFQFFLTAIQTETVSCDCAVQADFTIFMHVLSCLPVKLKPPLVCLYSVDY